MSKNKFIVKEITDDGYSFYYSGKGNWTNKRENAKVYSNKNILTNITRFEGNLEIVKVN